MKPQIQNARSAIGEVQLSKIEMEINSPLPKEYRKFLLKNNGGKPKPSIFPIKSYPISSRSESQSFLCINSGDVYDLSKYIKRYKKRIPHDMLPIAIDLAGNLICIVFTGTDLGKIYFWDHENEVEEGLEPWCENIYFVSDSFGEFYENFETAYNKPLA